jgi:hypothetical protein
MADYKITTKIKANQDYSGNVEDVVPLDFKILNFKFKILNQSLKIENFKFEIEPTEQKLVIENVSIKKGDEITIE